MMLSVYDLAVVSRNQNKGLSTWQYQTPEGFWCSADAEYVVFLLSNGVKEVRLV